ncbi:MAG: thiol reductase thioredoxin [Cytophagales bacterium CG12_big_fil_rev_8_21_14_0_65_40_12]|nr:MAG: thiol reductase thioredoxin [Cytophagales bacterium CG12_big_fil_rev_8_21_14_0_65_40_12]PIW04835.1 MAG: thiol reductase thioredoxin [Cytophagales bacterium CG17_big_fil_post_rev_8_21_14_2_50_40_13]
MEMLKGILILMLLLVIFPLATKGQEQEYNLETESVSDYVDKILNGPINKEGLKKMPYKLWFNTNYKTYRLDFETLKDIKKRKLKDLTVLAFMGTWCHDSNREIPRLMRVLDELGIGEQLELYALDVDKTSVNGKEKSFDIKKTPTIIFYLNGEEVARVLEEPKISFEKELVSILK